MSSLLQWLGIGTSATGATGDQLDAQLAAMNNKDYAPGGTIYNNIASTQGTAAANNAYGQVQTDLGIQAAQTASSDGDIAGAFGDGIVTGLGNIGSFIKNPFLNIPIWIWLVGAAVLFWWMGGLSWIRGILKKPQPTP